MAFKKKESDVVEQAKQHQAKMDAAQEGLDRILVDNDLNSGEIRKLKKQLESQLTEKIKEEHPDSKPKKYFSWAVQIDSVRLVLEGMPSKKALIQAAKIHGFSDNEIKVAKNLKFYSHKKVRERFKAEIDALSKQKLLDVNHVNWCKTLPQILKTIEIAHNNQIKINQLEEKVRELNLQISKSPEYTGESLRDKAKRLKDKGYTYMQIAEAIGKSTTTVDRYVNNR